MNKMRKLYADNIRACISHDKAEGGPCYDMKRLAQMAGLTPSTIGRIVSLEHAPVIDTMESIARSFRLQTWQMLVPKLDPSAPPVQPYTPAELALYERFQRVALAFAKTGDVEYAEEDVPAVRPVAVRSTDRKTSVFGPEPWDRRRVKA